jgi:putative nucleotidyltransferase with HDIG domain
MNALFAKSEIEREHSSRVSDIAENLCEWLGMSESETMEVRTAALLHDIGKIGIPENILNKPGKLSDEERRIIQKHPGLGWRILGSSTEHKDLATYILLHHEHWDGKGYPKGLKGEEIPIQSRIIAVADAYDAMTKDRMYRKALTNNQALGELEKNSGTQFDPTIVKAFLLHKNENINNA